MLNFFQVIPQTRFALHVFLLVLAMPVRAQLVVRVRSQGLPVQDVELVILVDGARAGVARTGIAGDAMVRTIRPFTSDAVLLARRIGFVPQQVPIAQRDTITLELQAVAIELPVLAVRSHSLHCPLAGTVEATRILESAARGYDRGQANLWFGYLERFSDEDVEPARRGYGDLSSASRRMGGAGPIPPALVDRMLLVPSRYAEWSDERGWYHAPLHERAVEHFSSAEFRERNTFVILDSSADATVIGFCPRGGNEPGIMGEISIGSNNHFQSARWSFVVSHDDDDSGGEVTVGAATYENARYLVAVRGTTWRRNGRRLYLMHSFELDSWRFGRTKAEITTGWTPLGDANARP